MVKLCLMCLTKITVKKFGDAKAAMEYLHKNFDELRKGEVQKEKEAMVQWQCTVWRWRKR